VVDVVPPSTALAIVTEISEKCKSLSSSAIQVKNGDTTIRTEEKLDIISQMVKGEQTVDLCHNVGHTHSSVHTICDNAERIREHAKSRTKVFVFVAKLPQCYQNKPYPKLRI